MRVLRRKLKIIPKFRANTTGNPNIWVIIKGIGNKETFVVCLLGFVYIQYTKGEEIQKKQNLGTGQQNIHRVVKYENGGGVY